MKRIKAYDKHARVKQLLNGMDEKVAASFTYKQRKALQKSINNQGWQQHKIDFRPTLAVPFMPWSFYLVFLIGSNRRQLLQSERFIGFTLFLAIVFFIGLVVIACVFFLLYLIKSWLGLDFFPNTSLGLWDKFDHYF
jgi:hypothetical protein